MAKLTDAQVISALHLFKNLVKDGCAWHGDVLSSKWSEQLFFTDEQRETVLHTLSMWPEDMWRLEGNSVWIV